MTARGAVALVAIVMAASSACGGDDKPSDDALPECRDLFAEGVDTIDLDSQPRCIGDDGEPESVASNRYLCTDGGELFVNEHGYGVKGEPWHADHDASRRREPGSPLDEAILACEG